MNKKLTLTIGISAYNEKANIKNMIESVLKQKGNSFMLENILIILDGCTDNTLKIVKALAKKDRRIKVAFDGKRMGKTTRLNQIYKMNESELIGTFDADIVLERDIELELMIKEILESKNINVVAGNQIPAKSNTLMGKFSRMSFFMFYEAAKEYRNGNNAHLLQGSASILRKEFAQTLKIPGWVSADQGFLYFTSTQKNKDGFKFVRNTRIIFNPVSSFRDWRVSGYRTIFSDKDGMARLFGDRIFSEYRIPRKLVYKSILKCLLINPLDSIGAIIMNLYIRRFPLNKKKAFHTKDIWEIVTSSKKAIRIKPS